MNHALATVCLALTLPCLHAAGAEEAQRQPPAYVMGIVPSPVPEEVREHVELAPAEGIFVKGVAPGSPAAQAGLKEADIILSVNGVRILSRSDYRRAVAGKKAGDVLHLSCLRAGRRVEAGVTLKPRAEVLPGRARPGAAVLSAAASPRVALRSGAMAPSPVLSRHEAYLNSLGEQGMRPLELSPQIVAAIREARYDIIDELAREPQDVDTARLTHLMQRLRDLARDANVGRRNWMAGKAGEAILQFRDEQGTVVLTGADNLVDIELLDERGVSTYSAPFNTAEQRRAVPGDLPARFRALQKR